MSNLQIVENLQAPNTSIRENKQWAGRKPKGKNYGRMGRVMMYGRERVVRNLFANRSKS